MRLALRVQEGEPHPCLDPGQECGCPYHQWRARRHGQPIWNRGRSRRRRSRGPAPGRSERALREPRLRRKRTGTGRGVGGGAGFPSLVQQRPPGRRVQIAGRDGRLRRRTRAGAGFVGGRTDDAIVFTRNTTDSINLLARCLPTGTVVITTGVEHHANLLPWRRHGAIELPVPASPDELLEGLVPRTGFHLPSSTCLRSHRPSS